MKLRRSLRSLANLLGLLLVLCATTAAATPDERFAAARKAYLAEDYAEAAYQLRELPAAGEWSHGALHNLGNAEWKVSRPGYAILAWERARALDPFNRNTVANLRFARTQAQLIVPEPAWFEQYSQWLPSAAWLWSASLGLWGGVALLTLPRLVGTRRADWHQGVAALLLAVFLLAVPALVGLHTRGQIGVVLEDETNLRLSPTQEGESLAKLAAGEMGRVEAVRDDYLYIRAEGDRAGWVQKREFARVWP